ncbi:MAG: FG-GAP-like repeat-containing protein [Planctomycetota bacterium]
MHRTNNTARFKAVPAPFTTAMAAAMAAAVFAPAAAAQSCHPADIFVPDAIYGAGVEPISVAIGDLDGDGAPDLAIANQGGDGVRVLLNNGDGTFQIGAEFATGRAPRSVAIGDVDGDGAADLVVVNLVDNDAGVLLGNGDGTFQTQQRFGTGFGPAAVVIEDLNTDGVPDLAVANQGSGDVRVLLGNGDGTFQAAQQAGAAESSESIAAGDLNGDGLPDLAATDGQSDAVVVLLSNGDGTFQTERSFDVDNRPVAVGIDDLDGDGAADLAVANRGSGSADASISVLLNCGDGTFQQEQRFPAGDWAFSIAIGDFNGDGDPDLATANTLNDSVSVLLNLGDGTFDRVVMYDAGNAPSSVAAADLDGDGDPDVAASNFSSNDVSVLINLCVAAPTITAQPAAVVLLPEGGGVAELTVAASGSAPLAYQWRRDGVDLADGGGVSGATTPTLTIDATLEDVASYQAVVSNAGGTVTSDPAVIAVRSSPCPADQNFDGTLTPADFNAWVLNFNSGCP